MRQRVIRPSHLLILALAALMGCGPNWSQDEKDIARHFVESIRLVVQANDAANTRGPGPLSDSDLANALSLYQRALREAHVVTDEVLAKANPELATNYRHLFQKGVELRVSAWTNRSVPEEIQGSALLDSWGDWYQQNRQRIKIPR
jgi:choline dehydrogenase-like flavoprotein